MDKLVKLIIRQKKRYFSLLTADWRFWNETINIENFNLLHKFKGKEKVFEYPPFQYCFQNSITKLRTSNRKSCSSHWKPLQRIDESSVKLWENMMLQISLHSISLMKRKTCSYACFVILWNIIEKTYNGLQIRPIDLSFRFPHWKNSTANRKLPQKWSQL